MARSTVADFIENYRAAYEDEIKAKIAQEDYSAAAVIIGNHNAVGRDLQVDVIAEIHFGLAFLASGRVLEQVLWEGDIKKIRERQEEFEAHLAQTKLPKSRQQKSDDCAD